MKAFASLFGGAGEKTEKPVTTTAPPPTAKSTITGAGVAPGTSQDDFKKQQTAYWQQLLSGTGQNDAGGALPQGVQQNISRQADLITQGAPPQVQPS